MNAREETLALYTYLGLNIDKCYILGSPLDDTPRFRRARAAQPCDIPEPHRWAHVAALTPGGYVIDCFTDDMGTIWYTLHDVGINEKWDWYACEYPGWSVDQLYNSCGMDVDKDKLVRYWKMRDGRRVSPIISKGTTCSELLAYSDNCHIIQFAKKPACDIVPTDFQRWATQSGNPIIQVSRKMMAEEVLK